MFEPSPAEKCQFVPEVRALEVATEHKYSAGNIVEWMLHVAEALAYMHSQKVQYLFLTV